MATTHRLNVMVTKKNLRIVSNIKNEFVNISNIAIHIYPSVKFLDTFDFIVVEEDTFQVLSADPEWHPNTEHPIRLMTDVIEQKAVEGGTLLIFNQNIRAIVHDLDSEPTYQIAWLKECYEEIISYCESHKCKHLAIQLLGCFHALGPVELSLDLLVQSLTGRTLKYLKQINLIANKRDISRIKSHFLKLEEVSSRQAD